MALTKLTRRDFLKMVGATTAIAIPAASGYGLMRSAAGDLPGSGLPYAVADQSDTSTLAGSTSVPVLLVTNEQSSNPFGMYLGQILRAEGLNCFQVASFSALEKSALDQFDVILLAEGPLSTGQSEALEGYVANGGRLVAMRPDPRLDSLMGLERLPEGISDGYLQTDPRHPAVNGIVQEALQFHGAADLFRLAGAEALAWLSREPEVEQTYPAVTWHRFGKGLAAAWAFDLARSIAYTRQGNPEWSNQERDGLDGARTVDLFSGWIDPERMAIPQADEQQRLLANLLTALSQERRPLPRLWYFPGAAEGMLVATSDSHMNPAASIEEVLTRVERYNGHISIYYTPFLLSDWGRAIRRARFWSTDHLPIIGNLLGERYASPTPALIANWRARGHEFTLHPYVEEGLEAGWTRYWKEFTGRGYGPLSPTTRTHRILWSGWTETARLQASYGIRMNLDFYQVGPSLQTKDGEWVYGYMTGSGHPMKFVDDQGRILDIYQQLTQLADDHLIDWQEMSMFGWSGWPKLSGAAAADVYRRMLDRSLNGQYSAIAVIFHTDPFAVGGGAATKAADFLEHTLAYAVERGIPIWSAQEWLRFTDAKHNAYFDRVQWHAENKRLSFTLLSQEDSAVELTAMIPALHSESRLVQVEVDGLPASHKERQVGGVRYAWLSVTSGSHNFVATYI